MRTPRPTVAACALALLAARPSAGAEPDAGYELDPDVPYRTGDGLTDYERARCRADVYHPVGKTGVPTVVWFHGGGLTGGTKAVPAGLRGKGLVVVAAGYRLSPGVKAPAYVEDAAAAVAWAVANAGRYGGSKDAVYVAGHSAGAYLSLMVGLDKRWLARHGLDPDRLAGLVPLSGQAATHFTIRAERGIPATRPVVDDLAPLYHVRKDAPPVLLVTGGRDKELRGRYEENAYLWRMLKEVGHPAVELNELQGYDHGGMAEPALPLLIRFVTRKPDK